jgi:hypothetical protein
MSESYSIGHSLVFRNPQNPTPCYQSRNGVEILHIQSLETLLHAYGLQNFYTIFNIQNLGIPLAQYYSTRSIIMLE